MHYSKGQLQQRIFTPRPNKGFTLIHTHLGIGLSKSEKILSCKDITFGLPKKRFNSMLEVASSAEIESDFLNMKNATMNRDSHEEILSIVNQNGFLFKDAVGGIERSSNPFVKNISNDEGKNEHSIIDYVHSNDMNDSS